MGKEGKFKEQQEVQKHLNNLKLCERQGKIKKLLILHQEVIYLVMKIELKLAETEVNAFARKCLIIYLHASFMILVLCSNGKLKIKTGIGMPLDKSQMHLIAEFCELKEEI